MGRAPIMTASPLTVLLIIQSACFEALIPKIVNKDASFSDVLLADDKERETQEDDLSLLQYDRIVEPHQRSTATARTAMLLSESSSNHWPSGHGSAGLYGSSPYLGPTDLNASFLWSWHHPEGRYHTLPYGTAIDSSKNIYLTTDTSAWKLTPNGEVVWSFVPSPLPATVDRNALLGPLNDVLAPTATLYSAGSLLDGRMHFTTLDGRIWAISMDTGTKLWSKKVCDYINHDNGFVTAHEGAVVAATDASLLNSRGANGVVRVVNATDGSPMWTYEPEKPIWNFMALFPGDGTVLYQDFEGRAYRHRLQDGALIWKSGGIPGSWTDGTAVLGTNHKFYTVSAFMQVSWNDTNASTPGYLTAFNLTDGSQVFQVPVPMPPNNAPAFGKLPGNSRLTVVQPGGWQGQKGGPTGVWGFDAETGERVLEFLGPSQKHEEQAGAAEGREERIEAGASAGYITNPWSAATIDPDGTIYLGHEDGLIFALRDENNDGEVKGENEVSTYDTGAAFVGSSSPAHAPGMMAIASCDSLYVFSD